MWGVPYHGTLSVSLENLVDLKKISSSTKVTIQGQKDICGHHLKQSNSNIQYIAIKTSRRAAFWALLDSHTARCDILKVVSMSIRREMKAILNGRSGLATDTCRRVSPEDFIGFRMKNILQELEQTSPFTSQLLDCLFRPTVSRKW